MKEVFCIISFEPISESPTSKSFQKPSVKQESPPAWMQEAYCSPCSGSTPSVVLTGYPPSRVPPPDLAGGVPYHGYPQQGTPWAGYPPAGYPHSDLARGGGTLPGYPPRHGTPQAEYPQTGVPPRKSTPQQGTPGRVPPSWTWHGTPQLDLAGYPLGVCPMEFWVMLQSIVGYGYLPPHCGQTEGQTHVKTLPSHCTT